MMSRASAPAPRRPSTPIELSILTEPSQLDREPEPPPAEVAAKQPPPAEPVAPAPAPPRRRERKAQTHAPEPAEQTAVVPSSAPANPAESQTSQLAIREPAAPAQPSAAAPSQPSRLSLSPQRAAASMVDHLDLPAPVCNPRGTSREAAACTPSDRAAFAERELNEGFRQAANAPVYRVQRDKPQLHRQADGGYRYDGHVFTARIREDGSVDFANSTSDIDGLAKDYPGVRGHFDPSSALEEAVTGDDMFRAEKLWFLEQTSELRDKLAAAARSKERAAARRALEHALEQILAADLDPAHKRERILALWDDCGDDAEATDARRIVEVFVRTRMPEGSELGFTRAELDRFNRGRSPSTMFEPYRT
jgi:hypothetical protein